MTPRPHARPGLVVGGLLALASAGLGAGPGGAGAAAGGGPGPGAEATATGGPGFPLDLAARVRAQFAALDHRRATPQGGLALPGPEGRKVPGARLKSRDPVAWAEVARRVAWVERFHTWVRAGGRGEALADRLVEDLRALDRELSERGYGPAFSPWADLRPVSQPVAPDPARFLRVDLPEGAASSGWGGRALEALAAGLEAVDRMDADIRDNPGPVYPGGIRSPLLAAMAGSYRDFLEQVIHEPDNRVLLLDWFRPGAEATARFLLAAGRTLEDPGTPPWLVRLCVRGANRLKSLFYAPFGSLPAALLVGGRPRTLAGWVLLGEVAWNQVQVLRVLQRDTTEALEDQLLAWERALAASGEGPLAAELRGVAEDRLVGTLAREGRRTRLADFLDRVAAKPEGLAPLGRRRNLLKAATTLDPREDAGLALPRDRSLYLQRTDSSRDPLVRALDPAVLRTLLDQVRARLRQDPRDAPPPGGQGLRAAGG